MSSAQMSIFQVSAQILVEIGNDQSKDKEDITVSALGKIWALARIWRDVHLYLDGKQNWKMKKQEVLQK